MIRVAFICDTFQLGGQEMGCLEVMRRLDRNRFAPYLYTFRPGSLLPEAAALGVPILVGHQKPGSDRSWTAADDLCRQQYRERLAAQLRADCIDACLLYAWVDGIEAAQHAGVRAIVERVDGTALASRLPDKSACSRIICESKTVRDVILAQRKLLRCRRDQIVVIPNGIDLTRFDPSRYDREGCRQALGLLPDDFVIGSVARLAPEKNLEHLVRAGALLMETGISNNSRRIRIVLVGPDEGTRGLLEKLAGELGIADAVSFPGPTAAVPEALRAFDIFAITSLYEGSPFSMLEAMAMALPVVATQVGAIPELIDGNGVLVCVMHPEETANALARLMRDDKCRRDLGRRSRQLGMRYDVDKMVRKYEAVLLRVLGGEPGSRTAQDRDLGGDLR